MRRIPKCSSHLPIFLYFYSVVSKCCAGLKRVCDKSLGLEHSSFYPLSLVWLWGWDCLSSWLPFFFFFFPDGLDLFWGMLLGRLVQGLIFSACQPLFLFDDFLPHLVVLQEVLSYLAVDFPPFESFLSWENNKLDYLFICWIRNSYFFSHY